MIYDNTDMLDYALYQFGDMGVQYSHKRKTFLDI